MGKKHTKTPDPPLVVPEKCKGAGEECYNLGYHNGYNAGWNVGYAVALALLGISLEPDQGGDPGDRGGPEEPPAAGGMG